MEFQCFRAVVPELSVNTFTSAIARRGGMLSAQRFGQFRPGPFFPGYCRRDGVGRSDVGFVKVRMDEFINADVFV